MTAPLRPTDPLEIDVQTLLPRDIPFVETLAHIARMVCFRVVTHEVPEGMRAGDCNCYSCAAYNCLVIRYGQKRADRFLNTMRGSTRA
jgi:hypothetical protein